MKGFDRAVFLAYALSFGGGTMAERAIISLCKRIFGGEP